MASIVKEVTAGAGNYGPWYDYYKRQVEGNGESASAPSVIENVENIPETATEALPQIDQPAQGGIKDPNMAYNDFYQRLMTTGNNAPQYEATHMVGQSLSPHRHPDPGLPTGARPDTNAQDPTKLPVSGSPPGTGLPGERPNVSPDAGPAPGNARAPPPSDAGGRPLSMACRVWSDQQKFKPKKSVGFVPASPMEAGKTEDHGDPLSRAGRLGAPWRHVKQCTGNEGNHICFIDGTVKENDMSAYPPYGFMSPRPAKFDASVSSRYMSAPLSRSMPSVPTKYNNNFSNHAKKGFKYWFEENKGLPGAKQTISGRLMKMGVGY